MGVGVGVIVEQVQPACEDQQCVLDCFWGTVSGAHLGEAFLWDHLSVSTASDWTRGLGE